MAAENERGQKIPAIDLRQLIRVVELTPEDMTVTVEAGITLGALQRALAVRNQWLPIDPPNPERTSVREILSHDLSGPRRFGYGTVREHLIGMKVVLADGRLIKSGGKVVKNVAGYDQAKLFIGSHDSLGIIVETTFKVRPRPEAETMVRVESEWSSAEQLLRAVRESEITPVIIDMHATNNPARVGIVLGFAGTRAEVDWQLGIAEALGFSPEAGLDYQSLFWNDAGPVNRLSILPSHVVEKLVELKQTPFVARAGNGVIYFRGPKPSADHNMPQKLMRRVKYAFDPKNILPEFTL